MKLLVLKDLVGPESGRFADGRMRQPRSQEHSICTPGSVGGRAAANNGGGNRAVPFSGEILNLTSVPLPKLQKPINLPAPTARRHPAARPLRRVIASIASRARSNQCRRRRRLRSPPFTRNTITR